MLSENANSERFAQKPITDKISTGDVIGNIDNSFTAYRSLTGTFPIKTFTASAICGDTQ